MGQSIKEKGRKVESEQANFLRQAESKLPKDLEGRLSSDGRSIFRSAAHGWLVCGRLWRKKSAGP
jgi:hypothetical protein